MNILSYRGPGAPGGALPDWLASGPNEDKIPVPGGSLTATAGKSLATARKSPPRSAPATGSHYKSGSVPSAEPRPVQWQPIRWLEESLNPAQLAVLYDAASAMLVNPVRDGLNLTAKEYVACQRESAGALDLSTRAGVWTELHQHALPVDPNSPVGIARAVEQALSLSPMERERRMRGMKQSVRSNSLRTWWQALTENLSGETAARRSA